MADSRRWLGVSVWGYRRLLRAYPKSFRSEYGPEMAGVFHDMAAEALRHGGNYALVCLWFCTVLDLGRTAMVQHCLETERRVARLWEFLGPARYRYLFAASMCMAALATPADLMSMLIVGTPLFGVLACVAVSAGLPVSARLPLVLTAAAGVASLVIVTWTPLGTVCVPWIGVLYGVCIFAMLGSRRLPRSAQVAGILVSLLIAAAVMSLRLWMQNNFARHGDFASGDTLEVTLLLLALGLVVPAFVASSSILLAVMVTRTVRRRLPTA